MRGREEEQEGGEDGNGLEERGGGWPGASPGACNAEPVRRATRCWRGVETLGVSPSAFPESFGLFSFKLFF